MNEIVDQPKALVTVTDEAGKQIGQWTTAEDGTHTPTEMPDPFADEEPTLGAIDFKRLAITQTRRDKMAVKAAEKGTYVQETLTGTDLQRVDAVSGEILPYTRVADLSDDLRLVQLEEIQGQDLVIWRFDKYHSAENDADFLTLEVSFIGNLEDHFLTNCGGQSAMRKIEAAFAAVEAGKARGPLIAAFNKIPTNNGRTFWVLK